jgi:hypothetical protein
MLTNLLTAYGKREDFSSFSDVIAEVLDIATVRKSLALIKHVCRDLALHLRTLVLDIL